ncbi:MAG: DNA polymerase III subunit gamma/tau [Acidobacteriota bacterium]
MARRPLARTYRPQRFAEVLGQETPVRALGRAAASGDVASCYIFSGTRGIGKTTIARLFAKSLICEQGPAVDCCDNCVPCREVSEGRNMDVLELDAATHTGIDDIRELREAALYPPSRDRYRLFILDEAHQLSTAAWNGLLKVLEEPPAWCVFMFCTTEPHKIPATIESRALHFAFKSPPAAQLRAHLADVAKREQLSVDTEALALLAETANGSVRDGLSALDQVRALSGDTIDAAAVRQALGLIPGEAIGRFVRALGGSDAGAALAVIGEIEEEGQDLRSFAAETLERVRQLAIYLALGGKEVPLPVEIDPQTAALFSLEQLVWLGKVLDETESRLRQNGPTRALLDLAAVRMTKLADLSDLATLIDRLETGVAGGAAPHRSAPTSPATPAVRQRSGSIPTPASDSPSGPRTSTTTTAESADRSTGIAIQAGDSFRQHLIALAGEIKPAMAAYLNAVREARLDANGGLRLVLAPGKEIWKDKLLNPATREVLDEAIRRLAGRSLSSLNVDTGDAPPQPQHSVTRREVLEKARKDPAVRQLFDRFGAVVLDGQPLNSQEE